MSGYSHLSAEERDRLSELRATGASLRVISRALGRAASTISRELKRNALDSGAYRPHVADGAYILRRQRQARLETDAKLAAYVTDRLTEGWTPEQVAIGAPLVRATMATGRLRLGIERGLGAVCTETIYGWIYRAGQKAGRLWRYLTRHHARRRKRHGRASRDTIAEKTHISQRSEDADARATVGQVPRPEAEGRLPHDDLARVRPGPGGARVDHPPGRRSRHRRPGVVGGKGWRCSDMAIHCALSACGRCSG
jgi:transposase, IS30 family